MTLFHQWILSQLNFYLCSVKPFLLEVLSHMDTAVLLLCSLGLCFSNLSDVSLSFHSNSSVHNGEGLFKSFSAISDYSDGSYDRFLRDHDHETIAMSYLYAKWDSDSNRFASIVASLHSFSPIKISAIDCWIPTSSCAKSFKVKHFPHVFFHSRGFNAVSYDGVFSISHIAAHISHLLNPIILTKSRMDLSRLQLMHKVVVFGQFGHRNFHLTDFAHFHHASLMTNVFSAFGLTSGRDIVFAASGNLALFRPANSSIRIRVFVSCASTIMVRHFPVTRLKAEPFIEDLKKHLERLRTSRPTCVHPTELGSVNHRRSTLLHSAFSHSPVLFLIGPHLSLMHSEEPELFLLRSLEKSYYWCNRSAHGQTSQRSDLIRKGWALVPHPTWEQTSELLPPIAAAGAQHRCRLSTVCPQWLAYVQTLDILGRNHACRPTKFPTTADSDFTNDNSSVLSQILRAMEGSPRSSEMRATVQCFLHQLSDNKFDQPCIGLGNHRDWRLITERLHFSCCQWYHRQLPGADYTQPPNCTSDGDWSTVNLRPDWAVNSPLHGLSCNSNRTLTFHTLDSESQPQLVWHLAGYDVKSNRSEFMAIIVDQQMEAVYRLEQPLSYDTLSEFITGFHRSTLRPWSKHRKPAEPGHVERSAPAVIEIRSAAQLNSLLDERTSIRWHDNQTLFSSSATTHLALLYHDDACAYASHGNSWRWHFETVARRFKPRDQVIFAKVDVSLVDLPWNLRVERLPSILFFPATRSSYSSIFSINRMSKSDVSTELIQFLHDKLELFRDSARAAHVDPDAASFHARTHLLRSIRMLLHSDPKDVSYQITQTCRNQPSASVRVVCFTALLASVRRLAKLYRETHLTSSIQLRHLTSDLNRLNRQLMSSVFRLHAPSHEISRIARSISIQSKLWLSLTHFHRNISKIAHFLTVELPSTISFTVA